MTENRAVEERRHKGLETRRAVAALCAEGLSTEAIAAQLKLGPGHVENVLRNLRKESERATCGLDDDDEEDDATAGEIASARHLADLHAAYHAIGCPKAVPLPGRKH